MSDVGIDDPFIKQVGESITPGTSALGHLVSHLVSHAVVDDVLEQTKDLPISPTRSCRPTSHRRARTSSAPPSALAPKVTPDHGGHAAFACLCRSDRRRDHPTSRGGGGGGWRWYARCLGGSRSASSRRRAPRAASVYALS
jgi:hypothetical protein